MKFPSFVYKQYLESQGLKKIAYHLLRKSLIKLLNDPECLLPVHGRLLTLPLSHALPIYLKNHPFYDRLPQRLSAYIHHKHGRLCCIDVGANIGDTVAAFIGSNSDTFLAIEPNPKFHKLLSKNWSSNPNVTVVSEVCSSESGQIKLAIHEKAGTASLIQTEHGITATKRTLDEILDEHTFAKDANLLKIDTDGHDFEVIIGSKRLLCQKLPIVLFECDVFDNSNYVEDCIKTLNTIKESGYNYFLLYDNFGNLMGKYSLEDLSPFLSLIFYQLTSTFYYFDILVMNDDDIHQFFKSETNYFTDSMPNKALQRTTISATEL